MLNQLVEERVVQPVEDFDASKWENSREKYVETLCKEEYGDPLPSPTKLEFEILKPINGRFAANTATLYSVVAHTEILGQEFSFPFTALIPKKEAKYPFFVHIDFMFIFFF